MPFLPPLRLARMLALAFIGCACFGCVSKPTMRLNHAEISGFQAATFPPTLGVLMTVVVDVYNPNSYDVAIRAMHGQVTMAEKYPLPLDFQPQGDGVWLLAGKTTQVRVPISIPLPLALALVREAFTSASIPYRVTGSANVTGTRTLQIEKDDYSVDERGSVTRQQMEAILPASLLPH